MTRSETDITSVYWRLDNTTGYTDTALAALSTEFLARWVAGDWSGAESPDEAAQWFADEVAQR